MLFIKFLLAVVLVEALTELLVKSEFFKPLRRFFFVRREIPFFGWVHNLLDCGYCTSVWAASFVMCLLLLDSLYVNIVCGVFVLHRLSNVFHYISDRFKGDIDL